MTPPNLIRTLRTMGLKAIVLCAVAVAFSASTARAGMLTFITEPVFASSGSSGSFDVVLTNLDSVSYNVASFAFYLSIDPASGVTFTNVDMNTTSTYIFPVSFNTLNSLPLSFDIPPDGTAFTASDSEGSIPQSFTLMNPGDSFGVAHVSYTVAANAPAGAAALAFDLSVSNVSDNSFPFANFYPVDAQTNPFVITPEPSTFALTSIAVVSSGWFAYRRKSRGSVRS